MRSRGNEQAVRVRGLGQGERIISRLDVRGDITTAILDRDGTFPLPEVWDRISFCKDSPTGADMSTTHVDLLVA